MVTEGTALQGMGCGVNHLSHQPSHHPKNNNTHTKKTTLMVILEGECFIVTNLNGQNITLLEVLVLVCIGQCSFFFKCLLTLLSHVHLSLLLISEESSEEDSSEDEKPAVKGK